MHRQMAKNEGQLLDSKKAKMEKKKYKIDMQKYFNTRIYGGNQKNIE